MYSAKPSQLALFSCISRANQCYYNNAPSYAVVLTALLLDNTFLDNQNIKRMFHANLVLYKLFKSNEAEFKNTTANNIFHLGFEVMF